MTSFKVACNTDKIKITYSLGKCKREVLMNKKANSVDKFSVTYRVNILIVAYSVVKLVQSYSSVGKLQVAAANSITKAHNGR